MTHIALHFYFMSFFIFKKMSYSCKFIVFKVNNINKLRHYWSIGTKTTKHLRRRNAIKPNKILSHRTI